MTPGRAARLLLGAGILVMLVIQLGADSFARGLSRIGPSEVLLAVGIGLLSTACSAARWRSIARLVGLPLSFGIALTEYYRASLLNSVLPGGVLGDLDRGVRHGRATGDLARGVRVVAYERVAGHVVLLAFGVALLAGHPELRQAFGELVGTSAAVLVAGCLITAGVAAASSARVRAWGQEVRAVVTGRARLHVLVLSALALAGHVSLFVIAARAVDNTAPVVDLVPLAVLGLAAMAVPVNVAGWGPREAASSVGFAAAGFGAGQGLASAVVFGVLALVSSTPGLAALVLTRGYELRSTVSSMRSTSALISRTSAASSGASMTVRPAAVSRSAPSHTTISSGSRQANTTRGMPAARMRSVHVRGRDSRTLHGSSEV